MALHDLLDLAVELAQPCRVRKLARQAYSAYGPSHPRLFRLAHDVAQFWITQGDFSAALPVLRETVRYFEDVGEVCTAWASIARASGGCGDIVSYMQARDAAGARLNGGPHMATALIDIAHGAAMLQRWPEAEDLGGRALQVAMQRGEARARLEAIAFLDSVAGERRASEFRASRVTADPLAETFVQALRQTVKTG
jgi:hypothetical protein